MGSTIIKEQTNLHRANDDMSLGATNDSGGQNPKRTSKRKGSDTKYLSKDASEHYFNNIAQTKIKNDENSNNENNTQSKGTEKYNNQNGENNQDINRKQNIEKNQMNSKSSCNLSKGVQEIESMPKESNSLLDEAYSHKIQKSSLLSNPGFSPSSDQSDIDIDMKSIFSNQRNMARTYTSSRANSGYIDINGKYEEGIQEESSSYSYIRTLNQNDYELNFYRNGEEIRRSYIAKLICKKVWTPSQKEKTHNSLIIFDWDDTLLCTSFLTPNGVYDETLKLSEKDKEKLAKLEFSVLRLLTISIEKGDVYIITNAGPGWVEFSAEKYYPSVVKLLSKITIISARGEYESKYPNDSRMWKIEAFSNMQKKFDSDLVTNIICLGDSFIEMEAGHTLAGKFQQAFIKTVKFRESPKPEELNKQLTLVADQFVGIYSAVKNLTIRVEKKKK